MEKLLQNPRFEGSTDIEGYIIRINEILQIYGNILTYSIDDIEKQKKIYEQLEKYYIEVFKWKMRYQKM